MLVGFEGCGIFSDFCLENRLSQGTFVLYASHDIYFRPPRIGIFLIVVTMVVVCTGGLIQAINFFIDSIRYRIILMNFNLVNVPFGKITG